MGITGHKRSSPEEKTDFSDTETGVLLKYYYAQLFPFNQMFRWLSYNDPKEFAKREFSFTIQEDVYLRYKSFRTEEEFASAVKDYSPNKIDIGAVFSAPPRDHAAIEPSAFQPRHKEFVVDIDVSDYADIWALGRQSDEDGGGALTRAEWPLMVASVKTLQTLLSECFGFHNIMWVYSGRRGVHGWVSDHEARIMPNDARSAVADFLQVYSGNERTAKKVTLGRRPHPAFRRVYTEILEPLFLEMAEDQEWFQRPAGIQYILSLADDHVLAQEIERQWLAQPTIDKWKLLKLVCKTEKNDTFPMEVVFTFVYPRLDIHVSKGLNHLLKSPFSVHPKTGRVCVPVLVENVDIFDPTTVPLVSELVAELDQLSGEESQVSGSKAHLTSLRGAVDTFERFVQRLEAEQHSQRLQEKQSRREEKEVAEWTSM